MSADHAHRLWLSDQRGRRWALQARFVVDASGRGAVFARSLGARALLLDQLSFVYGFFDTASAASQSRLTLLEAEQDGWWYAAGLPGGRLAVALATDAVMLKSSGLSRKERWLRRALDTRLLAARLDGCRLLSQDLVVRKVSSFVLSHAAGPGWLATGDAASVFDPLSAQGIHKALASGMDGAKLIARALATGHDLSPEWHTAVKASFDEYLVNRNHFYSLERRWPTAPFWQNRRSRTSAALHH